MIEYWMWILIELTLFPQDSFWITKQDRRNACCLLCHCRFKVQIGMSKNGNGIAHHLKKCSGNMIAQHNARTIRFLDYCTCEGRILFPMPRYLQNES